MKYSKARRSLTAFKMSRRESNQPEHVPAGPTGGGAGAIGPQIEAELHNILFTLQVALGAGDGLPDDAAILQALLAAVVGIQNLINILEHGFEPL